MQEGGTGSYAALLVGGEDFAGGPDRRNQQRKRRRQERNGKIAHHDNLARKLLGRADNDRSDGRAPNGRSFHLVLRDVIELLTALKLVTPSPAAGECTSATSAQRAAEGNAEEVENDQDLTIRDGLLCCEGIFCVEFQLASGAIVALGAGARSFFAESPWSDCRGHVFRHSVHPLDRHTWQGMIDELECREPLIAAFAIRRL